MTNRKCFPAVLVLAWPMVFLGHLTFAKAKSPIEEVENVLASYRRAPAVQARIKKTVSNEMMGPGEPSEGRFYFSKGRLRLDIEKPEKSLLVYDGKNIWLETHLDENEVQVTHLKAGPLKRTNSLLAALFDRKDVMKQFRSIKSSEEDGVWVYTFEPKKKAETEVRTLVVAIEDKDLQRITYKDQMENEVSFEFSRVKQEEVPAEKFAYRPPKNAMISEM